MKQIARLTTSWQMWQRRRQSYSDWQGWKAPTFPLVAHIEVEVAYHPLTSWLNLMFFKGHFTIQPRLSLPDTNPPITASGSDDNEDGENSKQSDDPVEIHLLSEEEANQFREPAVFDPTVKDDSSWQPPEIMRKYLEVNFDWNLSEQAQ